MSTRSSTHWWLAAEPLEDAVAWALTRVDGGGPPSGPVDGGLRTGVGAERALAASAHPSGEHDLWTGPLTDPAREHDLAVRLGAALLPAPLRAALLAGHPDRPDTVTVAVRGWLARVPWDALALDPTGVRLVERARVLGGLPATLHVGRARQPDATAGGAPLRVVDPGPAGGHRAFRMIYPEGRPRAWQENLVGTERIVPAGGDGLTADQLGALLRRGRPSRLLYFGHAVPGLEHAPAAAALILTDDAGDPHRLTAFDWLSEPARFPAPPRVAIIGCGSDDSELAEQSGLPIAAVNAGAALVTATRWVLPLDPEPDVAPTTALAVAVDRAHGAADPVGALRAWQLRRLDRWRAGAGLVDTPLLWAAPVSYPAAGRG